MQDLAANEAKSEQNEINLTPMLDVVFIMLIFFIVTASFLKESGLPVNRSEGANVEINTADSIFIQIDAEDRILINARHIDPRAVTANIKRLSSENPEAPVVVRPDPRSSNEVLVQVLDASR
jgi:biopolymer transport protein ExbD